MCWPYCMIKMTCKCIDHIHHEIGCYQKGGYDLKLAKKHSLGAHTSWTLHTASGTSRDRVLLLEDFSAQCCYEVSFIISCSLSVLRKHLLSFSPLWSASSSQSCTPTQGFNCACVISSFSMPCYEYTPSSHLLLDSFAGEDIAPPNYQALHQRGICVTRRMNVS